MVGGCVALVAATLVPAAPLRRPREQAAIVVRKISALLRAAGEVMVDGVAERGLELLADARATDSLIRELQDAADEGMAVVSSSPFRVRHRPDIRRMADLVEPLDRALRSTRVLVRQTAVAAYHHRHVPKSYSLLALDLADAADMVADELAADRMAVAARDALIAGRGGVGAGRAGRRDDRGGGARSAALGGGRPAAPHRDDPDRVDRGAAAAAAVGVHPESGRGLGRR